MENQVAGRQARRHTKNGSAAKPAVFFPSSNFTDENY